MSARPHFIIIGAMKSATSSLHEQLGAQPGIFVTDPKEPCFFSNDAVFARGFDWYQSLFASAAADDLCGESSTHYTKLPTYPETVERLHSHLPDARLIYVMRDPIDRLVSHYMHLWTARDIDCSINEALRIEPSLVDYSRYAYQLEPYLQAYGSEQILPVFFERLRLEPRDELERIARFIGYERPVEWRDLGPKNVSADRLRTSEIRERLVHNPVLSTLRRTLVPKGLRMRIRGWWKMQDRPDLSPEMRSEVTTVLDTDLARLGDFLSIDLSCANFNAATAGQVPAWASSVE